MPELPDILLYISALHRLLIGKAIRGVHVRSPFVLRTFEPPIDALEGTTVQGFSRCGKRIVWHMSDSLYFVVHPMIAGRFHWKKPGYHGRSKNDLLSILFADGVMTLTEAAKEKRAAVWLLRSSSEVARLDAGGIDVLWCSLQEFTERLCDTNRTLKRALTDPCRFDGIGNAYSDEILHAARLSPLKRTRQLEAEERQRLFQSTQSTLQWWIDRLQENVGTRFPEKITAFRPEMKVHGKFGQQCPDCRAPIQRIRYARNECNYCPGCQTDGRILSDRSLARILKDEWPKTLEELEG